MVGRKDIASFLSSKRSFGKLSEIPNQTGCCRVGELRAHSIASTQTCGPRMKSVDFLCGRSCNNGQRGLSHHMRVKT